MATKVIFFTIGGHNEQAEFSSEDSSDNVREVFRVAAEARETDILKLYNPSGNLINISPNLPENTSETRYRLEVVASHSDTETLALPAGFSIDQLESRLRTLESKILSQGREVPEEVCKVKAKLDALRDKLENVDHLSWLGLYKDLSRNAKLHSFWSKIADEEKSEEHFVQVWAKVEELGNGVLSSEVCDYLKKPSFDNWQWEESEMIILLRQMFIDLDLVTNFKLDKSVLIKWLFAVYKTYNDVPFHNFKHCFVVTQMMYGLIWLLDLKSKLDAVDILTLLMSAICHDLDHPGYNNTYQVNARTKLALLYNDISPLENHHCSVAFEILANEDVNILANVETDVFKRVREGMIRCILATDMAKHHDIVKSFRAVIPTFDWNTKAHKDLLMMILIKMADISNEVRPMDVADLWLECLLQEYFKQSDLEKLEGLPVAAFMDRDKVSKHTSQIGFIKFILLPLVEAIADLFPVIQEDIVKPVQNALEYYTQIQNELEADKQNGEAAAAAAGDVRDKNADVKSDVGQLSGQLGSLDSGNQPQGAVGHKFRVHKLLATPRHASIGSHAEQPSEEVL